MAKNKLILSTFLTLITILILSESFFRSNYAAQALLPPSYNVDFYPFDVQFSRLNDLYQQEGHVDCIFLGSSIVHYSFNPTVFEDAYYAQTGESIKCFNFGLSALSGKSAGIIAPVLVKSFHPRIFLYGVSPRSFGVANSGYEDNLAGSKWVQYINGDFNVAGFLIDNLATYRYYLRYQDWMSPEFDSALEPLSHLERASEPNGYRRTMYVDVDVKIPPTLTDTPTDNKFLSWMRNYVPFENDIQGLDAVGRLNTSTSTRIMFIEVPNHKSYLQYFNNGQEGYQNFTRAIQQVADQHNVPFWRLRDFNLIPDEFWNDRHHMNANGALIFSDWLGTQFGYAVGMELLTDDIPPDLLYNPPRPDLRPKDISDFFENPYGLSDQDLTAFRQHHTRRLVPQDEVIWNLDPDAANLQLIQYNLGASLGLRSDYTQRQRERIFDLLNWFERFSVKQEFSNEIQPLLQEWKQSHEIGLLHQAGINYLLITERWLAQQDEATQSMFNNNEILVMVQNLGHRVYAPGFLLYKIV